MAEGKWESQRSAPGLIKEKKREKKRSSECRVVN
jgi:hypothetical protein